MKSVGLFLAFILLLSGCEPGDQGSPAPPSPAEHAPVVTNRLDIPDTVRRNLGITFATVQYRPVAQVIRVSGSFELVPEARREYRTMLAGRVELLVRQYDRVESGTPLYRLSSPEWRDLQARLSEAESTIRQAEAKVSSIPSLIAAHRRHEEILEENIEIWEKRVTQLETLGGEAISMDEIVSAQNTLALQRAELAEVLEKEADLQGQIVAAQAEHDAAHSRFRLLISTASTLLGIDEAALASPYDLDEHLHTDAHPHDFRQDRTPAIWRTIDDVEVHATAPGVVDLLGLTNGAWASTGSLVLSVADPRQLRFRALAMQSDLGRLTDGLPARIVPPAGGSVGLGEEMAAQIRVGVYASALERTIELIAVPEVIRDWARPGVAGHLEIQAAGGQEELAIPLAATIQDGLATIFFRRDPANPDKVIRVEADLGLDDGRWVAVKSGLKEGDEVVLDGAYQLMIAMSGRPMQGGHFHPDGTFHAEDH